MVEIENITRWFGPKLAVDRISLRVDAGEVLGIIGPNGAGKSTTMRILTGYLPATSGMVKINGCDMQSDPLKAKSMIGYLPENAPVYGGMSVRSFLIYIGSLRGMSKADLAVRLDKTARDCKIEKVLEQGVETLSKGYRHRVCLAQALIHDPKVLVLDEPTDGLDPNQKREVRRLIRRLGTEGKTIILSTHILEEVEEVCGHVAVISGGRKIFDGTVGEFRKTAGSGIRLEIEAVGGDPEYFAGIIRELPLSLPEFKPCGAGQIRVSLRLAHETDHDVVCTQLANLLRENHWRNIEITRMELPLDDAFIQMTRPASVGGGRQV